MSEQTLVQGSGCTSTGRMQPHCSSTRPTPRLSDSQGIPNMSSSWAEIQVEVKIGELLMVEGKESMPCIIKHCKPFVKQSGVCGQKRRVAQVVFNMLISS